MIRPLAKLLTAAMVLVLVAGSARLEAAEFEPPTRAESAAAMRRAAEFYRGQVARHGGYVYFYTVDLQRRFGEGEATADQIWVQPPGTPTVGMAYLEAHQATSDPFYLEAATDTAEALLYGQLESGGWTDSIDFNPQGERVARYRNGKGRGRNYSTLDDDKSQAAIRFLMRADRAHGFNHERIREAVKVALDALLAAQFQNGAFPQGWDGPVERNKPLLQASIPEYDWRTEGRINNYWDMYTLNDGLAGTVAKTLIEAHRIYDDPRYRQALARLGDFLILAQLPDQQPGWAQQYNYEMQPIWARKFEPAAVVGSESQDAIATLLLIHKETGDAKYLEPVPRAIDYLRRSLLPDGRLARYYELKTNRPLYMQRRGDVYTLTYDDSQLPGHYSWKGASRLDSLQARYEAAKQGHSSAAESRDQEELARRARAVVDRLDAQGRWISTFESERLVGDQRFRPGDKYISSAEFADNLELLAEYVKSLE